MKAIRATVPKREKKHCFREIRFVCCFIKQASMIIDGDFSCPRSDFRIQTHPPRGNGVRFHCCSGADLLRKSPTRRLFFFFFFFFANKRSSFPSSPISGGGGVLACLRFTCGCG